jgi:hypothetical protein
MSNTTNSTNGTCPSCRGTHWKTLEALALIHRQHSSARTTGVRQSQRTDTMTTTRTEAADKYARPARPDDYDQLERYRNWCEDSILAAEARLAEIDGAGADVDRVLPGFFSLGPDAKSISFGRFSKDLERLIRYEEEVNRWKETKLCLRCATTFVDASAHLLASPAPVFRFTGQERHCPKCGSYFWKDPEAVARNYEQKALAALKRARAVLDRAKETEANSETKAATTGLLGRLAAHFMPKEPTVVEALELVGEEEKAYSESINKANDLRARSQTNTGTRWCTSCEHIYLSTRPASSLPMRSEKERPGPRGS